MTEPQPKQLTIGDAPLADNPAYTKVRRFDRAAADEAAREKIRAARAAIEARKNGPNRMIR